MGWRMLKSSTRCEEVVASVPGSAVVSDAGIQLFLAGGQAGLALCKRSDHPRLVLFQLRL